MTNFEIVQELLKVAGQVGIFGIAAFWIQKIIENTSNKRLEEFKLSLSLIETKENSLHAKRIYVMETLYSKLVDLDFAMQELTQIVKFVDGDFEENDKKLVDKASSTFKDFHSYFEKNKIYFTESTCLMIHQIRDAFYNSIWDYNAHKIVKASRITESEIVIEAHEKILKAYRSVKEEIPKLRSVLETEFRKILLVY
jgi:hypothetical protein